MQTFENLLLQNYVCLIKDWPNYGATYIISEIIAKTDIDNLIPKL